MKNNVLLSVRNIDKYFKKGGYLFKAVKNASFDINKGDFFGVIGESGSGKSTIGKMIIRLLNVDSGTIVFDDNLISQRKISKKFNAWLCKNMQMVFQDPMGSLNPKKNIINIISEPLKINKSIKKEANELINKHIKINQFFQYTYKQKDFELSEKFDNYYFSSMIEIFSDGVKYINDFQYDTSLTFDENKFNFTYLLSKLDEKAKKNNYSLYKYSNDVINIFNECEYIHDNKLNHELEIELFNVQNEFKKARKLLKHSNDYYQYIEDLNNNIQKYNEHITNSSERFIVQNKNFINGLLDAINIEISNLKQNLSLSTDLTNSLMLKFKIKVKKIYYNFIKNYEYYNLLSFTDIQEMFKLVENYFNDYFSPIINKIMDLGKIIQQKNKYVEKLLLENKISIAFKKLLTNDPFYVIKTGLNNKQLSSLILNLKYSDNEFSNIIDQMNDMYADIIYCLHTHDFNFDNLDNISDPKNFASFPIRIHDIKLTNAYKNVINDLKKIIKLVKNNNYKHSNEYAENFINFQNLQKQLEDVNNKCQQHYVQDIDDFNNNVKPKINAHNKKLKAYIKELSKLRSKFKNNTKKAIFNIFKVIKKDKNQYDKDNWLSFKNDVYIKLRTIDAINFEFQTILEEVKLYRNLRSTNSFYVKLHKNELIKVLTRMKVYKALNSVGLKNEHAYRYPHEFSGGQRQRIVIARALINNPKLIIADEPISALDVSIQAQVINIMKDLVEKKGITFMFVAHDLSMVNYACNRMIIMHNGRILEKGDTKEIFDNPIHPYTLSLLKASPELSKIHIDLALDDNQNNSYDSNKVDELNSSFYNVSKTKEHYVYGTKEQLELWTKTNHHLD